MEFLLPEAEVEGGVSSDDEEEDEAVAGVVPKHIQELSDDSEESESDGEQHNKVDIENDDTREQCERYLAAFRKRKISSIEDRLAARELERKKALAFSSKRRLVMMKRKQAAEALSPPVGDLTAALQRKKKIGPRRGRTPWWKISMHRLSRKSGACAAALLPKGATTTNSKMKKKDSATCTKIYCNRPRKKGKFLCGICEERSKIDVSKLPKMTFENEHMNQVVCNHCTAMNTVQRIFDPFICTRCGERNERVGGDIGLSPAAPAFNKHSK